MIKRRKIFVSPQEILKEIDTQSGILTSLTILGLFIPILQFSVIVRANIVLRKIESNNIGKEFKTRVIIAKRVAIIYLSILFTILLGIIFILILSTSI